ncbi:hypothetical protein R1flu_003173 [Riccia fluitans]|uniref:Transposase n=1 Tax=Riccia fluitans TaxID=41844 RepID=A0ABD1Y8E1_9MARC
MCTEPLVVYVDCRFDSSRSGYHGTLPIINVEDDRVIEMVTLTRKQVRSSWKIENAALEQALTLLEAKGLAIAKVIHDDNTQVAVFSIAQLKDYCQDNGLQQIESKLQLVQCVSMHLKLPEAGANTEIQRQRPLKYPELAAHDLAYKLKSWIYTCGKNAAVRHNTIVAYSGYSQCGKPLGRGSLYMQNPAGSKEVCHGKLECGQMYKYPEGGETHKAVADFLKKYITENKMKCYVRAKENFISETFHSVINKFTTKRIQFDASHTARFACAAMDWNENIRREVRAVYH